MVVGLPSGKGMLDEATRLSGHAELWTGDGELRVTSDAFLEELLAEEPQGVKVMLKGGSQEMLDVQRNELAQLRITVDSLREDRRRFFDAQKEQDRLVANQQHRIEELEKALLLATTGEDTTTSPLLSPSLHAHPTEAPPPTSLRFDTELSGTSLEFTENNTEVKATHLYNKIALTEPALDSRVSHYAEFIIVEPFSRYTCIGVCLEKGLPRINVNTDALGEHDYTFGWNSHEYWSACFTTKGMSRGPKGGEWEVGSRVGILVENGSVSFYLNGTLRHQHIFTGVTGEFRFGIGFGGPRASPEGFGKIKIVPHDELEL